MNFYRIRDWDIHFELAQGRKVKNLSWVIFPVKHDGLGYRRLMAARDGAETYGAWVLIVQVAAKCPLRGTLVDERGPLGPQELSLKTGCPAEVFERAIQVLCMEEIGWLISERYERAGSALVPLERRLEERKEEERKEERGGAPADAGCPPELSAWISMWNRLKAESFVATAVDADRPSRVVISKFNAGRKSAELRKLLADRDAIEKAIRASEFCKEPWFTLPKLLGGKNRTGEWIAQNLLEGAYVNRRPGKPNNNGSPGRQYDPKAAGGDF